MNDYGMDYNLIVQPGIPLPDEGKPGLAVLRDLKGMTIGVTALGAATDDWARAVLTEAGGNLNDVTFVAMGGASTALPTFEAGKVDAMVSFTPVVELLGKGKYVVADSALHDGGAQFKSAYIYSTYSTIRQYLNAHASVVNCFCKSIQQTLDYAENPKNSPVVEGLLQGYLGLTAAQAKAVWAVAAPRYTIHLNKQKWNAQGQLPGFGSLLRPVPNYSTHVYQP